MEPKAVTALIPSLHWKTCWLYGSDG